MALLANSLNGVLIFLCGGVLLYALWARRRYQKLKERFLCLQTEHEQSCAHHKEKLQLVEQTRDAFRQEIKLYQHQLFEEKQQSLQKESTMQLQGVLSPLKDQIQRFEKQVSESYEKETRDRIALHHEIKHLKSLNEKIAHDATQLTDALQQQSKVQGIWGELILERLLESSGLKKGREYALQVSLKNQEGQRFQPDAVIYLPENKALIVDAKVSLRAYLRYCDAANEAEKEDEAKAHVQAIQSHIRQLSSKQYEHLESLETLDFVILFFPIESAFSMAVEAHPALLTEALAQNIVLTTPMSFMASLRAIENVWRLVKQNQHAHDIAQRAGRLYDKFAGFVTDMEDVGRRLELLEKCHAQAMSKLCSGRGNLLSQVEQLKALGANTSKKIQRAAEESNYEEV